MSNPSLLSSSDVAALNTLVAKLSPKQATTLDWSNPDHKAAVQAALKAAGRTAANYPTLHNPKAGSGGDVLQTIDRGKDKSGRATAMAWHASGANALFSGGTIFAMDGETGKVLATGYNSNVGDGFVAVSTDTPSAQKAGKSIKTLSINHTGYGDGTVAYTAVADGAATEDDGTDPTIEVEEPLSNVNANIIIALGRDAAHSSPDADYTYEEPQNLDSPYLIVPFVGLASLPYEINGTKGETIPGTTLITYIYYNGNSGSQVQMNTTYTKNFTGAVTMNADDYTTLEWSYPFDGQSYTNTLSLVYNQQALVNDTVSYFFYSFTIPVLGSPNPTYQFAVCSCNTPNETTGYCKQIQNIQFWWHCLAAGTQVTLADGSMDAIEKLSNKNRVRTGQDGKDLAVEATSRGGHKASRNDAPHARVYRLKTDQGQELTATGSHPVMTPSGLTPLFGLSAGDAVSTDKGTAKVASCDAIDYKGEFYDLKLGDASDRAAGLKADAICTYVANGIVVGDHIALRVQRKARARDIEFMRPFLPKGLDTDYASAIADIRY
jgi:hypothetical protein